MNTISIRWLLSLCTLHSAITRTALVAATIAVHLTPAHVAAQREDDRRIGSVPRDVALSATQVFNAPDTKRIRGNYALAATDSIRGDLAVLNGSLRIAGTVTGQVVVLNGNVTLLDGARIGQSLTVLGGTFESPNRPDVGGDIRVWSARYRYHEEADSLVAETDFMGRWSNWVFEKETPGTGSELFMTTAHTYNRVEGLPIILGPRFNVRNGSTQVHAEVFGIFRTGDRLQWSGENLGHRVSLELREGKNHGFAIAGQLFNEVTPMERWQLTDAEVGLNAFVFTRDYRDYYQRHGGEARLSVFSGTKLELSVGAGQERWDSRKTRQVWSLFSSDVPWRVNPEADAGVIEKYTLTGTYDTRSHPINPRTGWYLRGEFEHGTGTINRFGSLTDGVRLLAGGQAASGSLSYSRALFDLRRYNRIGPRAQINLRLVAGGWVQGDPLPVQRRLAVSGLDALPGFGFRRLNGISDVGTCAAGSDSAYRALGRPAQCERIVLAQAEWKGDFRINLFGDDHYGDSRWRFNGLHADGTWVVFVNSGRGWLIHSNSLGGAVGGTTTPASEAVHNLTFPSSTIPSPSTWHTDIGGGFDFGSFGVYVAQAVSESGLSPQFYVRLSRRF